ncbi:hypothetical protein L228DRAFT_212722 [Xylona heveae TC161]|uniref:HNH nuclease domain-containing protein n=1 Tax=Xylona heveae (strain CBS 132557 / TC161) TaxID=1328760 RepID=A0A165FVF6_XYLHT|nr:hypothetical protein L228DRAFT_212722 [Xylona heveae TC161]KZF21428.1 hypothetical protein L228DRAFT_212722 [Xylona heveae TC161]
MASPSSENRHRSSLEGILDFSPSVLKPDEAHRARRVFRQIIKHNEQRSPSENEEYNAVKLVRLTEEYLLCEQGRDRFLNFFFTFLGISVNNAASFDGWDEGEKEKLYRQLLEFSNFLFNNFYLPLMASAVKTPQPSAQTSGSQNSCLYTGTNKRLSELRGTCLKRDHHRCIVSRKFDFSESRKRAKIHGDNAKDDEGRLLVEDDQDFDDLEVAHIIPHSLMDLKGRPELDMSKQTAIMILDMFDYGIAHKIEGCEIDRPFNALTLTPLLHRAFGDFEIFFEPATEIPHSYRINRIKSGLLRVPGVPVTRTLFLTPERTIDPPSAQLLAIHRAIAHILHLSGAGIQISDILQELEDARVQSDGSTHLEHLVNLRLQGWWNGIHVY